MLRAFDTVAARKEPLCRFSIILRVTIASFRASRRIPAASSPVQDSRSFMSRFSGPLPIARGSSSRGIPLVGQPAEGGAVCDRVTVASAVYLPRFRRFQRRVRRHPARWGVFVNGVNPVARTNVAPVIHPPSEPALYGFCLTMPCANNKSPTFVVAGAGELPEGLLSRDGIVGLGDTSPEGLAIKAHFVMDLMETRLHGLGVDWPLVSTVNVYTAHSLTPLLPEIVLGRIGPASLHGTTWHFSRPPIKEIEYEMDVRGTRTDLHC